MEKGIKMQKVTLLKFASVFLLCLLLISFSNYASAQMGDSKKPEKNINKEKTYVNKEFEKQFKSYFSKKAGDWIKQKSTSVFSVYVKEGDFKTVDGKKVWNRAIFELDPTRKYDEAKITDLKTVVIYPIFTDSAYSEPGFYTYYRNECDKKCLTVKIKTSFLPQANPNAAQVLKLLGYSFITDLDVEKNPSVLTNYDKVILLHNEYVTKKEFYAITKHPHVVYLYPNSLYAEVKVSDGNTITLVRGHNYPTTDIRNGFGWEFDNSQYEYDTACKKLQFVRITNGWMTNCYPENVIHKSLSLLKTIKKL